MSYVSIAACAADQSFRNRVASGCATEAWNNVAVHDTPFAQQVRSAPTFVSEQMSWAVATAGDVEAAYESAVAAGNPDPGGDPAVITDGMILANVQAKWPA